MKNVLKKSLNIKLNESNSFNLIEEMVISEDYPLNFDLEKFKNIKTFSGKIKYCQENLKRISSGSSRIVYMIDETKVLKLAKNKKGLAQNEVEIQWGNDSYFGSILATTIESDDDLFWVEMELARKVTNKDFMKINNCTINELEYYLKNLKQEMYGKRPIFYMEPEVKTRLNENDFVRDIAEFMDSIDAPAGDFGKLSSYGIVKRNGEDTIVLIDFGLTNDVYDTYY